MNPWKGTGKYQLFMAGVCARLEWANIKDMKHIGDELTIYMKNGDEFKVTVEKVNKVVSYPHDIKNCPGYEGHVPRNLTHEVCKHCGSIQYYH